MVASPVIAASAGIIYAGEDSQSEPCPLEAIDIEEKQRSLGSALKPIFDELDVTVSDHSQEISGGITETLMVEADQQESVKV